MEEHVFDQATGYIAGARAGKLQESHSPPQLQQYPTAVSHCKRKFPFEDYVEANVVLTSDNLYQHQKSVEENANSPT